MWGYSDRAIARSLFAINEHKLNNSQVSDGNLQKSYMPKLKPIRIAPTTPNRTKKIVLIVFPVMAFSEKLTPYTILKPILEVLSPRL